MAPILIRSMARDCDVIGRMLRQPRFGFKETAPKRVTLFVLPSAQVVGPITWYSDHQALRSAIFRETHGPSFAGARFPKPSPQKRSGNKNVPAKPKDNWSGRKRRSASQGREVTQRAKYGKQHPDELPAQSCWETW